MVNYMFALLPTFILTAKSVPPEYRLVYVALSVFEGETAEQIAEQIGLEEPMVKSAMGFWLDQGRISLTEDRTSWLYTPTQVRLPADEGDQE